jgi:hypothetical protein
MTWPSKGIDPYPRPVYRPGYHGRHRLHKDCITVRELYERLVDEQMFVRPIRQTVVREGQPPRLEQIDIYGNHVNLGPVVSIDPQTR